MRLCPTVEGSPSSLITHRIGADVCQARQGAFFHKCHRCIYRGKAADWKPVEPPPLEIVVESAGRRKNGTPAPARKKPKSGRTTAPGKAAPGKAPGKTAEAEA